MLSSIEPPAKASATIQGDPRVALLVMACSQPECLGLALPIYIEAGFRVIVHLDRKANLEDYLTRVGPLSSYCEFLVVRRTVFWAGFSMVEAEMALLSYAFENYPGARMFPLVSDDTLPIVSPSKLLQAFDVDVSRIGLRKLPEGDFVLQRYRKYYFFDSTSTALRGRTIENADFDIGAMAAISEMEQLQKKGKKQLDVYYGSQWWSLTRALAEIVLSVYSEDTHLVNSFRYSAVPDEIFVQTIVCNYGATHPKRGSWVYVDWHRNPKPYIFKTVDEIKQIRPIDHLFIRKVSAANYGDLINFIGELISRG